MSLSLLLIVLCFKSAQLLPSGYKNCFEISIPSGKQWICCDGRSHFIIDTSSFKYENKNYFGGNQIEQNSNKKEPNNIEVQSKDVKEIEKPIENTVTGKEPKKQFSKT